MSWERCMYYARGTYVHQYIGFSVSHAWIYSWMRVDTPPLRQLHHLHLLLFRETTVKGNKNKRAWIIKTLHCIFSWPCAYFTHTRARSSALSHGMTSKWEVTCPSRLLTCSRCQEDEIKKREKWSEEAKIFREGDKQEKRTYQILNLIIYYLPNTRVSRCREWIVYIYI